jgi:hypothetical protein
MHGPHGRVEPLDMTNLHGGAALFGQLDDSTRILGIFGQRFFDEATDAWLSEYKVMKIPAQYEITGMPPVQDNTSGKHQ